MRDSICSTKSTTRRFAGFALRALAIVCCFTTMVRSSRAALWIGGSSSAYNPALPTRYPPGSRIVLSGPLPAPAGEFQWYHDGRAIPSATEWAYTIAAATTADTGNYQLVLKSDQGTQRSNTATVNILPEPPRSDDPTFTAQLDMYARPYVRGIAADGSLVVWVGSWLYPSAPGKTVRLLADGTIDPAFTFPAEQPGRVLAVLPGGEMITSHPAYRYNRDCLPDPLPLTAQFFAPTSSDLSYLWTAAIYPDGKFLVATDRAIARFTADGALDPTFGFTWNGAAGFSISDLQLDSAGHVYVTGGAKQNPFTWRSDLQVFRLLPSGQIDSSFIVQKLGPASSEGTDRIKIFPLQSGRLLRLDEIDGVARFSSLNSDGSLVPNWSAKIEGHFNYIADLKNERVYTAQADTDTSGTIHAYNVTATGLAEDPSFYVGVQPDQDLVLSPQGDALYCGGVGLKRLKLPASVTAPVRIAITLSPASPEHADANTLAASINSAELQYEWLALDGQPLATDHHSAELLLPVNGPSNHGRYQLRVTGPTGVALLSNVIDIDAGEPVFLANLSGRAFSGTGENMMIAGFTTDDVLKRIPVGDHSVPLLIRGIGPALGSFGISNPVPNPVLTLHDRSGAIVASNDNWSSNIDRDVIRTDAALTGAFALSEDGLDASLVKPCYNQQFTAQLSEQSGQSGVGLLEIYRVPKAYAYGELTNLSLRANTGSGEHTAIAGFVLADPQNLHRSARVLLRVIGPALASYGITHPLADPVLTLFSKKGEVIRRVDNWGDDSDVASLTATMKQVGAFDLPRGSKDAAVVLDLPAGVYTMHAAGGDGVVLMEIYLVR